MKPRKPATILLAPLLMAVAFAATAHPAMASVDRNPQVSSYQNPQVNPTWKEYRGVHKTKKGNFSGDWVHCTYVSKAKYTQTASCSRGRTVTLGVSATFGFTKAEISASVGFNVSYSTTVTAGNSVTIKPGGHGWFDVGFRYTRYTVGMEVRTCSPQLCLPWSKPKTVTVQKHLSGTFHYFGTGAK